jgi:hypothetical protein
VHTLLFRASSEARGLTVDPREVTGADAVHGVPHGPLLTAFADAALAGDAAELARRRAELRSTLGDAAAAVACGVIAHFCMLVRIADATGIPLDAPLEVFTQAVRTRAGIDEFRGDDSRHGGLRRGLSRLLAPLSTKLFPFVARRLSPRIIADGRSWAARRGARDGKT